MCHVSNNFRVPKAAAASCSCGKGTLTGGEGGEANVHHCPLENLDKRQDTWRLGHPSFAGNPLAKEKLHLVLTNPRMSAGIDMEIARYVICHIHCQSVNDRN